MEHKSPLAAKAETQALVARLLQVPVFHRLNGRQIQFFVKTAEARRLAHGEVLCRAGEKCGSFYILTEGALQWDGLSVEAPATVCEVELLTGAPLENDVVSSGPSEILEVPRRYFALVMTRNPAMCQRICRNLIGQLAHRLQGANDDALELEHRRAALETALEEAQMELNDLRMLRSYR